ncbi:MAG: GGDEF domain-containing protein [Bdellovibrionales bacterium]|nr:GGDEF domain-containing protein [Bdellovibrionales bacterium]
MTDLNYQSQLEQKILALETEVRQLRTAADFDDLTGCLRRNAFMNLIQERRRFGWLPQNMTLAVVDLDHFKKVNDEHGHLAGDEALRSVARLLRDQLPEGGMICRMGGEEFVILVPGTTEQSCASLEHLRRTIASTPVKLEDGRKLNLSASIGASNWNTDSALLSATARADAAVYQAKRQGRNQVVVTNPDAELKAAA